MEADFDLAAHQPREADSAGGTGGSMRAYEQEISGSSFQNNAQQAACHGSVPRTRAER